MSLIIDDTKIEKVIVDGIEFNAIEVDGVKVWFKQELRAVNIHPMANRQATDNSPNAALGIIETVKSIDKEYIRPTKVYASFSGRSRVTYPDSPNHYYIRLYGKNRDTGKTEEIGNYRVEIPAGQNSFTGTVTFNVYTDNYYSEFTLKHTEGGYMAHRSVEGKIVEWYRDKSVY